jgi:hypothetical protein
VRQQKAVVYQEVNGRRTEIASQYVLAEGGEVGFKIGAYDRSQPLVIDPVLVYSTTRRRNDSTSSSNLLISERSSSDLRSRTNQGRE